MKVLSTANESTCDAQRKYFHFLGLFFAFSARLSFATFRLWFPDSVLPDSNNSVYASYEDYNICFSFPYSFFSSPAHTCAGTHALRAPHVYNIMRAKCKSFWNAFELLNNC